MKQRINFWPLNAIALCGLVTFSPAIAQVVPDATLPVNSKVTPSGNTNIITDGTQAGKNLFHSFEQFSIPTGSEAFFNNASDIQNIISRVTGGSISNIDGLIEANGNANLFLINPNGIIFGPNASLNIGGSFLASTASSLNFANGSQFSATAPQTTPLLTVSVPIGLQFGRAAGSIQNQSQAINSRGENVGLQVPSGKTLALLGGDLVLAGGKLTATDGRIELGSVAGNTVVNLRTTQTGYALSYEGVKKFQDISLRQAALVTTRGNSGGSIQVQGANVTLTEGSAIDASLLGAGVGEGLTVNASNAVQLIGTGQFPSGLFTTVLPEGTGNAGDLRITTPVLFVADGAGVQTASYGAGNGGSLIVNTSESVQLVGSYNAQYPSGLFTGTHGTGKAGDLIITTPVLLVADGAVVDASTYSSGKGGSLIVNASKAVRVIGTAAPDQPNVSGLSAQADWEATGKAGDLRITTPVLLVANGAQVRAVSLGAGDGGSLIVNASESVQLIGSSADSLQLPSGLFTGTRGTGNAGDLTVTTPVLLVADGAAVDASTLGSGKGGNLIVNASKSVQLRGRSRRFPSGLFADTEGSGQAGNLRITTPELLIAEEARATVSSTGKGVVGDLGITASSVQLDNGKITAENFSGNGGNLMLNVADLLLMRYGSQISTTAGTAQAGGDGGNITINTIDGFIIAVPSENSDINANAFTGKGGRVQITTQGIFGLEFREKPTPLSDITASSDFGVDGVVEINTPDLDPSQGLVALPAQLTETEVKQACQPSGSQNQSEFVITGRGGLPPNPSAPLNSEAVWIDLDSTTHLAENRPISSEATKMSNSTAVQLVEATKWTFNDKGEVVLAASASTDRPHSPGLTATKCHAP